MTGLAGSFDPVAAWTPPEGMGKGAATAWRTFYRSAFNRYGITPEQYRALYLAQLGRCYICRKAKGIHPDDPTARGSRRLGVDHNHALGNGNPAAVRGLLCTGGDKTCNRIIGWLDHAALVRAAELVETAPAQAVLAVLRETGATPTLLTGMLVRP